MSRQKLLQITWTLFLFLLGLVLVLGILMVASRPSATQVKEELRCNDLPLLNTVQQVYECRRTGYATFHIGKEYYVVDNLPEEYIEYSEWLIRMP